MKRESNDQFLEPLKKRPGLSPNPSFKKELWLRLRSQTSQKKFIFPKLKAPLLVGVVAFLFFAIFSKDIMEQIYNQFPNGTKSNGTEKITDEEKNKLKGPFIIKWNGSYYVNKGDGEGIITPDLVVMKLGEITAKVKYDPNLSVMEMGLEDGQSINIEPGTMVRMVHGTEDLAVKVRGKWLQLKKEVDLSNDIEVQRQEIHSFFEKKHQLELSGDPSTYKTFYSEQIGEERIDIYQGEDTLLGIETLSLNIVHENNTMIVYLVKEFIVEDKNGDQLVQERSYKYTLIKTNQGFLIDHVQGLS